MNEIVISGENVEGSWFLSDDLNSSVGKFCVKNGGNVVLVDQSICVVLYCKFIMGIN